MALQHRGQRTKSVAAAELNQMRTSNGAYVALEVRREALRMANGGNPIMLGRDDERAIFREAERAREGTGNPIGFLERRVLLVGVRTNAEPSLFPREVGERRERNQG